MPSTNPLRLVTPIDPAPAPMNPPHLDVLAQLRTLGALRADGVLTQEEYESQRLRFVRFFVNRSAEGAGASGREVVLPTDGGVVEVDLGVADVSDLARLGCADVGAAGRPGRRC